MNLIHTLAAGRAYDPYDNKGFKDTSVCIEIYCDGLKINIGLEI
jgi:hypothetical protein